MTAWNIQQMRDAIEQKSAFVLGNATMEEVRSSVMAEISRVFFRALGLGAVCGVLSVPVHLVVSCVTPFHA